MKFKWWCVSFYLLVCVTASNIAFAYENLTIDESKIDKIVVVTDDKGVFIKGQGTVFAKDKLIPVIVYATDSEGAIGFATMFSPLVKINPAIIDFTAADWTAYAFGYQREGNESHTALITVGDRKKYYIDKEYIIYPMGEKKETGLLNKILSMFGKGAKPGPLIEILFYRDDKREMLLSADDISIKVTTKDQKELEVDIVDKNRFLVYGLPRDTINIAIRHKATDKSHTYKLYPQFRGIEQGVVEYAVPLVGLFGK